MAYPGIGSTGTLTAATQAVIDRIALDAGADSMVVNGVTLDANTESVLSRIEYVPEVESDLPATPFAAERLDIDLDVHMLDNLDVDGLINGLRLSDMIASINALTLVQDPDAMANPDTGVAIDDDGTVIFWPD